MKFAAKSIPQEKQVETPLFILATAGMRLIEHEKQEAILSNIRQGISENYEFHFSESHLEIISGKQEGIYQWLAINYVLDKFDDQNGHNIVNMPVSDAVSDNRDVYLRPRTVGAIDMGGASMQIAMEVTSDLSLQGFSEKDKSQVVEVNLGCRDRDSKHRYRIFVTTFLGYGANEAIARYHRHVLLSQLTSKDRYAYSQTEQIMLCISIQ